MIRRKLFENLKAHLDKKEYTILTGARQTGKSTLLRQLETYCRENLIPCVFLNLENKVILAELQGSPLNVLKYLPDTDQRIVVFVDEVQYLDDPSNFLKHLYDEHAAQIKIVASGSSAFYIDDRFTDSLAGRKKIFHLYTCSFDEYLLLSGKPELLEEKNRLTDHTDTKSTQINYLQQEWETYMIYGGYPAIVTEPDKREKRSRLREIRDSFVKRDILEAGITNEIAFYNLFRILAEQSGNLVNVNELSSTLRIRNETVNNYLNVMQKCFYINLLSPFFQNLRKELTKMPKVFMLDTGLRNCLIDNFQPVASRIDKGELWENTFFRILADQYDLDSIHFWRTSEGNEVDFVLSDTGEAPQAIEVKYDQARVKPGKYKLFTRTYPDIPLSFAWMYPFNEDFFRKTNF
jgi:predicted AAA+ superfamily ATPase